MSEKGLREKQAETTTVVVMYSADTRKVKITARTDDTVASEALLAEHGVSILVELASGYRWLIDTGTTDISMENARRMGRCV